MAVNAKLGAGTTLSITTDSGNTYTQIKGITSLGATGQTKAEIDVTALEDMSKNYIAGLNDGESKTIGFNWDDTDAGQAVLKPEAIAGNVAGFKIDFPNGVAATFDMALLGWMVDEPTSDGAMKVTVSGRMTGDVTWA